ncbi:xyloglucan endotransglucosylase/hydrolase protein 24-like [Cryptomeria japonica]|uniref:xyloglucan endotransglucosylase/hydrolase protein 24-like n=1 Tax=Cryptomeria japonica TaxID=3369 RepID=UPI0027DA5B1F|nr:xyloglucan endotransglucosylase/hydrolase protein 24-like [Cryptomeria japonica]
MALIVCFMGLSLIFSQIVSANFYTDIDMAYGTDHTQILENGQTLKLSLDQISGCRFQSKNEYLFGQINMKIRLVPGNSAGTVTAYYLSSDGSQHDEMDFEFLGNLSGDPYIVQTNVFSQCQGNREQRIYLWFDPIADFHTYSVLWNPQQILFSVDGIAVRVFKNNKDLGVAYPESQAMRIYGSLWDGDSWATRGGLVKIDWSKAPFVTYFRNLSMDGCLSTFPSAKDCATKSWWSEELSSTQKKQLTWVHKKYMVYDYCSDTVKFPNGPPAECTSNASF